MNSYATPTSISAIPTFSNIQGAAERIAPYIHSTPVLTSQFFNELTGAEIYFKCENFQKVGAFKIRGATNAVLSLREDECQHGVATHSSGNHAQAVALAARNRGIKAYIVMPSNAPVVKINAVKGYGGEIIFCEPTLAARESTLQTVVDNTNAAVIHPYDDYRVITGQATAALELLQDYPRIEVLIAPVGGGGLLSGTALAAHYVAPQTTVLAAEPEGANDAYQSFQAGKLIPLTQANTIADGLRTSLGEKNFPIIQQYVRAVLTVNDEEIIAAMRYVWERMKIIIEPSCAVPVAAAIRYPEHIRGKHVGIILTGGNVDLENLPF